MRGTAYSFTGLEEFAAKFPEVVGASATELLREIHASMHERLLELAREVSPVGTARASGRPSLRASWRSYPPNPQNAIAAGRPTKVGATAPHALVIEGGRQMAKTYKRRHKSGTVSQVRGRMVGSKQAPVGLKTPILTRLAAEEEAIVEGAIRRVMGGDA
ncbi:MAG: hypothetical protein BWY94_02466 [Actinobacteria bacterium ADurb.BinA094]|nr:MAG: hypothetical protein BWY94_02466 [Actinobacteria bacterium ADurb.BinA094]